MNIADSALRAVAAFVRRAIVGPTMRLNNDNRELHVLWPEPPPQSYNMTAERVEEHMKMLGIARSVMVPPVPDTWFIPGQKIDATVDPRLNIGHDALGGRVLLHVRDPGFGWLHFAFDRDSARDLGEAIINAADAPPPEMQGRA